MRKFIVQIGALVALLSFSACNISSTHYPRMGENIGSTVGLVFPTNFKSCGPNRKPQKEDPLPKNVPHSTWTNTDWPPVRFRKNNHLMVYFESPNEIQKEEDGDDCDSVVFAYQNGNTLHLPNPCLYPKTDAYAKMVCHELGHYNGWPGYHGD